MGAEKIAYQGEPGSNSHIACINAYPGWETLPRATFEDALGAISGGIAALGMIPIENSIAGRVADIHHLLPNSGLYIVGEYFLPVHFHLLGVKGARIGEIQTVYSHVHALGQCRKVIRKFGLSAHVTADTAGSAREVAEWADHSRAAIATRLAAEIYGLDVLAEHIEDEPHNTTRFVVLSKNPQWPARQRGPVVTSFVFRVRNVPAALYKALGGFATNGINMTKLESYMVEGEFTATQFLADVEAHPEDPGLARAFEELAFFCKELKILGVYPAHPFRIECQRRIELEESAPLAPLA
ncbi:MAG TPA: prephenate dehydratase [Methylocella sp.]|nr:prephenate dehydratase [Methylocella sp.]